MPTCVSTDRHAHQSSVCAHTHALLLKDIEIPALCLLLIVSYSHLVKAPLVDLDNMVMCGHIF